MAEVALVCGASSGLGARTALALAQAGYVTYAGARSFSGEKAPPRGCPEGCRPLALDVTDDRSVEAAVSHIASAHGRLDVVVNCAAQIMLGAAEEVSLSELLGILETNFVGAARVARAALPVMRAQKKGRIVQFSSLNGLLAIPFTSAYIASKHAVEGYFEALAQEVRPFGVRVTLVEPGDCRSGSAAYRRHAERADSEESPYRAAFLSASSKIRRDEDGGMRPEVVARAVVKVLQRKNPPARLAVARIGQRAGLWLHDLLPSRLFNWLIARMYCGKRQKEAT